MIGFRRRVLSILVLALVTIVQVTLASQAAGTETLIGIVGNDFILIGADSSVSQSISLTSSNLDKIAPLSEPFFYDERRRPNHNEHHHQHQQQCIVAAAVGDAAASDRLVGQLKAYATISEYESGLGCDVEYKGVVIGGQVPLSQPGLDVEAMAYFARSQIASALRSRAPFQVCLLIAGMMASLDDDDDNGDDNDSSFVAKRVQQQVQNALKKSNTVETTATTTTSSSLEAAGRDKEAGGSTVPPPQGDTKLKPRLYWLDEYGSVQGIQYGAHGYGSNFCLSILDQGYKRHMSLEEAHKLMKECFQQLRTRYVINSPQPPCIKCVDANGIRLIR